MTASLDAGTALRWPAWPEMDGMHQRLSGPHRHGGDARDTAVARAGRALADATRRRHCALATDWATALVTALRAVGAGPGDVVLMPATTWAGCVDAVSRTGALPIFFDASSESPCAIGRTPEATPTVVLAVHLYAQRCDIEGLRARYPGAPIIEEASHAPVATVSSGRRPVDATVIGLQASCVLTSGTGGAVLTDDPGLAARARGLIDGTGAAGGPAPLSLQPGVDHAMPEPAAVLLLDQLRRLPGQAARRARAAGRLAERLAGSRWRYLADDDASADGMFAGVALRIPDGRGPRERVVHEVRSHTGLALDATYPPGRRRGDQPLWADEPHAPSTTPARSMGCSRWWRHRHIVIPHHAFLADDHALDALADALLADRPPAVGTAHARPSIDVVMVTKGRRSTLVEALTSVAAQRVDAAIRVTLFLDGPAASFEVPTCDGIDVRVLTAPDDAALPGTPWDRIAVLRQLAAEACDADYTAFIDDDNLWAGDHLASLLRLAGPDTPAVHSWRELIEPHGAPAEPVGFPWLPPGPEADDAWRRMVTSGTMTPGEAIVREGADIGMVDMGGWLFATWLLRMLRFHRPRTPKEIDDRLGEDDILLAQLCDLRIPIACTERATLRYRLGGMSNPETPRPGDPNREGAPASTASPRPAKAVNVSRRPVRRKGR